MTGNSLEILLVEDNPADVRLTREAFKAGKIHNTLMVAKDGVEAMAYLRRQGNFLNAKTPNLIFLDLNLPRKDGREVLAEIKADPTLRRIPVAVLTTSQAESDIRTCYDLHVNCYLVKPVDLDQYIAMIRGVEQFWLTTVTLPDLEHP